MFANNTMPSIDPQNEDQHQQIIIFNQFFIFLVFFILFLILSIILLHVAIVSSNQSFFLKNCLKF